MSESVWKNYENHRAVVVKIVRFAVLEKIAIRCLQGGKNCGSVRDHY